MPKLIQDEFSGADLTRQQRYQLRRRAKGLCRQCGTVPTSSSLCPECQKKNNRRIAAARVI